MGQYHHNTDHHLNYFHFNIDISNEQSVKDMFLRFRKKFKRLDILINNAGVASMNHTLLTPMKLRYSQLRHIFD